MTPGKRGRAAGRGHSHCCWVVRIALWSFRLPVPSSSLLYCFLPRFSALPCHISPQLLRLTSSSIFLICHAFCTALPSQALLYRLMHCSPLPCPPLLPCSTLSCLVLTQWPRASFKNVMEAVSLLLLLLNEKECRDSRRLERFREEQRRVKERTKELKKEQRTRREYKWSENAHRWNRIKNIMQSEGG